MIHKLKTYPAYFQAIARGDKRFEVRVNDRNFQVGDILELREYDPATDTFSGLDILCRVHYVMQGGQFGVHEDYCVMSFTVTDDSCARRI